ncbi:MAG: nucleotidyltransferase domain-containing protein [Treponema sp.]|nr:nucleotidyltransferase domain-containing protein [Treponema sp.]
MSVVKQVVKRSKKLITPTDQKQIMPALSKKISFICSLILDSVEPGIIKKIYLFGSYAYGRPNKKSDIDICIIISDNQDDVKTYMRIAHNLYDNDIIPADILLYKENEFINFSKTDGIENLIFTKGKILYG